MSLTPDDVEEILAILDSTDYDELHLETDRFVLRLRREAGGWTEEHQERRGTGSVAAGVEQGSERGGGAERGAGGEPRGRRADRAREGLHPVLAPLPGVLYRAPKPGEPPFVEAGDRVSPDTVVAILETMKLMNPVRAGAAGTVAEFAVANGEPAEQGAVLLWLTPDTLTPDTPAPDPPAPGGP